MFEDENLDDLDIGFPSPTAPSSPGTRASSLEVPEARGKGQEEDFGECCSGLSLQVFGVVSRFGVVFTVATCHWDPRLLKRGPIRDPIFSEMGTKWGPSAAEWGPKKQMFVKLSKTR